MSIGLLRRAAVALAAFASVLALPGVATADHGHYAHWGKGFDPWVEPAPHLADWAFAAVDRWNSFGVRSQMNKGVQDGDCDIANGEISVCGRNKGHVSFGLTFGTDMGGITQSYLDSSGHTRASVVEVCQNCGYSSDGMQYLLSHELGHAIALDHTLTHCASVVNSIDSAKNCFPKFASDPHEKDSLRYWYNHPD